MLLHGNGADESNIFPLGEVFPAGATIAAPRGPITEGAGFRWFSHRAVGQPIAASLAESVARLEAWLDADAADASSVWLMGFSGGAMIAGALALHAPQRYAGIAMLHGAVPFDAGLPVERDRLAGNEIFYGYGSADEVIPRERVERSVAWLRDESGANAVIREYRAAHEIPLAEARDLERWYASLT